jgi:outer membrane protein OmpA-like peptidoglycan-associated protein
MKATKAILLGTVSTILLSHLTFAFAAQPGATDQPIIIAQAPPAGAPAEPDPRQKKEPGKKEPGTRPPGAPQQRPGGPAPGQPPQHAPGAPPPGANQGPPPGAKQPGPPPAKQPTQAQPPAKQPGQPPATQLPAPQPPATQAQPPAKQPAPAQQAPTTAQPPVGAPPPPAVKQLPPPGQPPAGQARPQSPVGAPPSSPPAAQQQPAQPPAAQQQPQTAPGQAPPRTVGGPAAAPAAPLPGPTAPPPAGNARRMDQLRGERHETHEGNSTVIREPGRVIIQEAGRAIIRHDENERFRAMSRDVHSERRGNETVTVITRPDGFSIVTVVDENGRLIRRSRRGPDGREVIIIDNRYDGPAAAGSYFVDLPPPVLRIPRERYILEAERASEADIYAVLTAPPVDRIDRRYTLDEVRYSPGLRERMSRVDLDTITFDTGSWEIAPDQMNRLAPIAEAIRRAVSQNPGEVFLLEGHTDAVGSEVDNLSLSDRRAESVAIALTEQFQVPAENLTTQGYGEQYLKIPTREAERQNRRVTARRITPLLSGSAQ